VSFVVFVSFDSYKIAYTITYVSPLYPRIEALGDAIEMAMIP
jgi:hypothetical protein